MLSNILISGSKKMAKEIRITDNFMFATVMKNENICRPFIERMLGIGIEKI